MKKKNYRLLAAVLALAAVLCAGIGFMHYRQEQDAGKEYEKLKEEVKVAEEEPEEMLPEEPEEEPEEKPVVIPVDFASLQERNPDVYAWIRVPGTNIDYPILQSAEDNGLYLRHSIDKEWDMAGCIYTENYNSKDFDDPNTLIYGHDMSNGTMFRELHRYEDKSFFDENREVRIYLPDAVLTYEIFAAYVYDDRHIMLNFNFDDPEVYQEYLDGIFAIRDMNAHIDTSVEAGTDDRIITLSTCNGKAENQRYLVQAVLVSIDH